MARQKRRGAPDQPVNQEEKSGSRLLKTETGKQAKMVERAQVTTLSVAFREVGWGGGGGASWQGVVGAGTTVLTEVLHEYHRDPVPTMTADMRKGSMSASSPRGGASCLFFACVGWLKCSGDRVCSGLLGNAVQPLEKFEDS